MSENGNVQNVRGDTAKWWDQVQKHFTKDSRVPDMKDYHVEVEESKLVLALVFDTSEPPYLVNNPKGGTITHEVPYRIATSIKTANRAQLIKILLPVYTLPTLEILKAKVVQFDSNGMFWEVELSLFVALAQGTEVCFPLHHTSVLISSLGETFNDVGEKESRFSKSTPYNMINRRVEEGSPHIIVTDSEATLSSAGRITYHAELHGFIEDFDRRRDINLEFITTPINFKLSTSASCRLERDKSEKEKNKWVYTRENSIIKKHNHR